MNGANDFERMRGNRMSKWHAALGRRSLLRRCLTERDPAQGGVGALGEEGATLVEMAICSSTLFCMLFGIIGMSLALYAYNFVNQAARDATRWAIVRGSQSCSNTPNLADCNATSAEIQAHVQGMGYPGITSANLNVTTTWFTVSASPPTTWTTCTTGTCNAPGNEVQVQVTYVVPLGVPFLSVKTISVGSTSEMVIAQ
jgi:Flp pilus assembly protein TadG